MGEFIGALIGAVLVIVPLWRIVGRTGFNPALSLLVVIPWLGFVIIAAILAFAEWPSLRKRNSSQGY